MSSDLIPVPSANGAMSVATTRQAAEVQGMMIMAKTYPRDENAAILRTLKACRRQGLAECAMYSYPKGKQVVTGASIRLAEAIAQSWGNIDYGLIELEQRQGESSVMAYCTDLETNTRRQMVFQVPHIRSTREGNRLLTDPRDIYELVANQGARRVRACILGVIPGDVQDLAVAECEKTLATGSGKSLDDRIRDMVIAFDGLSVTKAMLEARLQHPVTACTAQTVVSMQKIYLSIRDGISKREDWFELDPGKPKEGEQAGQSRTEKAAAKMKKGAETKPVAEGTPDAGTETTGAKTAMEDATAETKPAVTPTVASSVKPKSKSADPFDVQIAKAVTAQELTAIEGAISEAVSAGKVNDDEAAFYRSALAKKRKRFEGE